MPENKGNETGSSSQRNFAPWGMSQWSDTIVRNTGRGRIGGGRPDGGGGWSDNLNVSRLVCICDWSITGNFIHGLVHGTPELWACRDRHGKQGEGADESCGGGNEGGAISLDECDGGACDSGTPPPLDNQGAMALSSDPESLSQEIEDNFEMDN